MGARWFDEWAYETFPGIYTYGVKGWGRLACADNTALGAKLLGAQISTAPIGHEGLLEITSIGYWRADPSYLTVNAGAHPCLEHYQYGSQHGGEAQTVVSPAFSSLTTALLRSRWVARTLHLPAVRGKFNARFEFG